MQTNRRTFMGSALAGGLATALSPSSPGAQAQALSTETRKARYARLDKILRQPVLKRELFADPVIIESLELLRYRNSFLCRVRSKDGAVGMSVAHSGMRTLYPIFVNTLQPFFVSGTLLC